MATTTNYSWTTPDDTALVKDGALAIRTLGSSVDTTVKNLNPETTLGDISYRSSTANVKTRLALGTANQQLRVNSGATAPEWFTPAASGGMTLISSTTLSGASITLSAIPATYKHLQLVVQNFKPATDGDYLKMRFNSDSNANRHFAQGNWTKVAGGASFNNTSVELSPENDNSVATGLIYATIPDYANTTTWKYMHFSGIMVNQTTTTTFNSAFGQGYYNQTAAISSLDIFPNSGNFTSGTVLLYGVS
jgi:hypothetical protein